MTRQSVSRIGALLLAFAFSVPLAACEDTPSDDVETSDGIPNGYYVLSQKTVEGHDVTDGYLFNCLSLSDGEAVWYETDYFAHVFGKDRQAGCDHALYL